MLINGKTLKRMFSDEYIELFPEVEEGLDIFKDAFKDEEIEDENVYQIITKINDNDTLDIAIIRVQ